ncbi:GAF domain-containing protein [Mucilaginibacter paludis]|uniref:PAS/PAC sensor protein n=1 Tax=Mucilaginibacter paludis DSM 18603 TaxID=714943 RepID=H1Y750_9SPHI|nr:GAF domain-containing protein [Mucilaginibacter paludis]EHQ28669.1 putative PAS/PAC sensor protein [Mucilaginibacter paludis DSM 18603]
MAKNNYDSDFCGSLPLNHINVIQPYGYLLVLEKNSLNIIQASENIADLTGEPVQSLIGKSVAALSSDSDSSKLNALAIKARLPLTLTLAGKTMHALAHLKDTYLLLELELMDAAAERTFTTVFEEVKHAITAIEQTSTVDELSRTAILELRRFTGFDGIMMYRFDKEWNGTVIAQEKNEGLDDYMGHTFPASDVPRQARELYLKNPYRLIPDRNYNPIRLYPVINPGSHTFTDLSDCNLRGVAAVHLEYLKNMNVQASMSIRVIHGGQLWGLIACHHITPLHLNFEVCSICELLSSVISNKVSAILQQEIFERETELQKQQTALVAQVYAEEDLLNGMLNEQAVNLTSLFQAAGAVAVLSGRFTAIGQVPPVDFIENMILWLQNKSAGQVFHTEQLPEIFDEAIPYADVASGALAITIDKEKGDFIICFRPEVVRTINWGGNPNQAINFEPGSKNYHPRNSFKIWQETVRHTALPWSGIELDTAETLRSFIYEFRTRSNG